MHELHLYAHSRTEIMRTRQSCRICARPTRDIYSHHQSQHVESVTIVIGDQRQTFNRGANGTFNCPHCAARIRRPVRFRVSRVGSEIGGATPDETDSNTT